MPNDPEKRSLCKSVKGVTVDSEGEYREFIRNNPTPDGKVWKRSPFTAEGKWKVTLGKESVVKTSNTGLEKKLRSHLKEWGYWKYFEQDYSLDDEKRLDFADNIHKVALEPGAVHWHTPADCKGDANNHIGEHPKEVYSPVVDRDLRKQELLEEAGWCLLWMTQTGVEDQPETIRNWLEKIYE